MRVERLSSFPWVVVRIACDVCPRRGRYRLARLAVAFGAEAELNHVLFQLSEDCPVRIEYRAGHIPSSCAVRFADLTSPNPPTPDLPGTLRRLKVIDGGRKDALAKPVVPHRERNPRRAYEKDGTEIEPGRIADMIKGGVHRVRVFCPAPCWHHSLLDVSDLPAEMAIADIGLHLRCSECGRRGCATVQPDWPNQIPQKGS